MREWVAVYVYFKDEPAKDEMQPLDIKVLERNCKGYEMSDFRHETETKD